MVRPSRVQYHATVMVAVFLGLLGLALFAFLNHRGVGAFEGKVDSYTLRGDGVLEVRGVIENAGTKDSRANCRAVAYTESESLIAASRFLTPTIEGHGTTPFTATMEDVSVEPASVLVSCR